MSTHTTQIARISKLKIETAAKSDLRVKVKSDDFPMTALLPPKQPYSQLDTFLLRGSARKITSRAIYAHTQREREGELIFIVLSHYVF